MLSILARYAADVKSRLASNEGLVRSMLDRIRSKLGRGRSILGRDDDVSNGLFGSTMVGVNGVAVDDIGGNARSIELRAM